LLIETLSNHLLRHHLYVNTKHAGNCTNCVINYYRPLTVYDQPEPNPVMYTICQGD